MQSASELKSLLARIDRRGYTAYKETRGSYQFPGYLLSIDHVQGDPFAAPSRLSIRVQGKDAAFPPALYRLRCQRVALEDALLRRFGQLAQQVSFTAKGSGHSGLISVSRCGQQVLERTACRLDPERGDLLLRALELGVYNHIAGDGREYVITDDSAVKIRSEDGRSVRNTDISAFINDLPSGKDTLHFSTEDASGSTSQAANLIEAVEAGSRLLLIDEDTSATNFMVRDALMQRVVCREMEPITPFLDRARELFENWGISTVLVAGSSGAFFHIADRVIQMERYLPREITAMAKREAAAFSDPPAPLSPTKKPNFDRRPLPGPEFSESERIKLKVLGQRELAVGRDQLDLRGLEQLADPEQTAALGRCLIAAEKQMDGRRTMQQLAAELDERIEARGLEVLCAPGREIGLARPRKQEIFACLNRYRALKL